MDIDVDDSTPPAPEEYPDVDREPPAWAEDRTPLGDAIPWFRKFQGGMHTKEGILYGVLISGDAGVRSYIDDEIIITRTGGSSERDAEGKLSQVADQKDDTAISRSVNNSMKFNIAVGVVIGKKNKILKRKLPHAFNVMDYFRVAYVWHERIDGFIAVRFRLEKLELEEKSWWAEKGSPAPPRTARRKWVKPIQHICGACAKTYYRIYMQGWMCLNTSCNQFWKLPDGNDPPVDLDYDPKWLDWRHDPSDEVQPHYSLVPDCMSVIDNSDPNSTYSRTSWKNGIVCPNCKQCLSRRFWDGWRCDKSCGFRRVLNMQTISLRAVIDDYEVAPIRRAIVFDPGPKETALIEPEIDDVYSHPYRRLVFDLPGAGTVTHFVTNREINAKTNGPNDLFIQLQQANLGLRRYPLSQAVVNGTLNTQFAVNYGMPYGFVVAVDSLPFSEACDPILRVMGRLTWATHEATDKQGVTALIPNELLALGYFEDMAINYHDDGEDTLGPTIASLSLGAMAHKSLRMKYKYYNGFTKGSKKLAHDDPVLEGCANRDWRLDLKQKLDNNELDWTAYEAEWWRTYKANKSGAAREAPPCIKTQLHHGDLVVMHGDGVQKYYEHQVELEKGGGAKLRYALTARHVLPAKIEPNQWPKGQFRLTKDQEYKGM
ncbi:2OG-Fe(II) oxygenase superfamily-domain-containing protein [Aspergillus germanicus]